MMVDFSERHDVDAAGNPAGGFAHGEGFEIDWSQAKTEDVLAALSGRLRFYLDHPELASAETAQAMRHVGAINGALERRHADREKRGVRGTFAK